MATSKKTPTAKTASASTKDAAAQSDKDNIAKVAFDRVKDAIPSTDGVASAASDVTGYLQDPTNIDLQRMADDASKFVRRNPGTSLAAAAGLGILIGILATKRS